MKENTVSIRIYKILLANLLLLRNWLNLSIDIKFIWNYNIFPNFSLILLGTYSSSSIFIRKRKKKI